MKKYQTFNCNGSINVMIEIMEGDFNKYEYNEETGELELDRIMQTTMSYPANYGFILGTKGEDGDALDVLLISSRPIIPGAIVRAKVIGMFEMEDEGGIDQKILCVPDSKIDQKYSHIECFKNLEKITLEKIVHFFKYYKDLEKDKWVKIQDDCRNKEIALELIKKSQI